MIHTRHTEYFEYSFFPESTMHLSIRHGDLNLHTGFDLDGGDLLDNIGRGVQVDQSLVHPHLELIPSVSSLSVRRLPGHNLQPLHRHPHRPLVAQVLGLGSRNEVLTAALESL